MNRHRPFRFSVISADALLRIIIPARIELAGVLLLGYFLAFILAFGYVVIVDLATKMQPADKADTWLIFAFAVGLACFAFPIAREFLLALGGRREIITLTPSVLCIRFSTLGIIQNREFATSEVGPLLLVPREVDMPWPGGYIQFGHIRKTVTFARQVSLSEAEVLIQLMYRTWFFLMHNQRAKQPCVNIHANNKLICKDRK